jgi:hypothetical protein
MKMTFLLYTLGALIANAGLVKILYISIQPGQWLDQLLSWQRRLQQWDIEGKQFLAKAGGYCELCFSHILTVVGFFCYAFFMNTVIEYWISDDVQGVGVWVLVNLLWYLLYVSIGTNLALYFIVKLFRS